MLPGWNVEVHAAAAVLSAFCFSIFFHLFTACQCTCQAAVQRFLEKESSCSPAHVLKRRLDDTGIYRVQVTFVQYIFIHIYTFIV